MNGCVNLENVGQVEELLLMTEQMQDELDQKDQTIMELNRQLSESLTLNEKLNSENRAENIEALRTRLKQTEEQLTSETDSRKRADAEVVAWKFRYKKQNRKNAMHRHTKRWSRYLLRKRCLMRNAKNVTALLTRKQKRNAITVKSSLKRNIKI